MSAGPLLTPRYVAEHPELAGARCYDAERDGVEHRLDFQSARHDGDRLLAEGYCGSVVTRLVLDGDHARIVCDVCSNRGAAPSVRQQAAAEVAA